MRLPDAYSGYLFSNIYMDNCIFVNNISRMRSSCLFFVFVFSALGLSAQTQGWFTYDTTNSAIPSNLVTAVYADTDNAIWVGTFEGLAKFEDFFNWTVYRTDNSNLPNNRINCINQAVDGKIWLGTLAGGLAILDNGVFTVYNSSNSPLTANNITDIAFEGNIAWICTDGGGLYRFDGTNWQNFTFSNTGFQLNTCYDVEVAPSGIKWIATLSDGLIRLSGSVFTRFNTQDSDIPHSFVRSLGIENDTAIWVGMGFTDNDSALALFNGNTDFTVFSESNSEGIKFRNVWDILVTDANEKWIATNDEDFGAILYNDTSFVQYSSFNSGLPYNRVYSVAMDTANVWFATARGLAVFNEKNAFLSTPDPKLMSAMVFPNPSDGYLNITLSPEVYQARILVFNVEGLMVWRQQFNDLNGGTLNMDVSELKPGMYFGLVMGRGKSEYFKFIRQ